MSTSNPPPYLKRASVFYFFNWYNFDTIDDMEVDFLSNSGKPEDGEAAKPQVDGRGNRSGLGPVDETQRISSLSTCGFFGDVLPPQQQGTPCGAGKALMNCANTPATI